MDLEEFAKDSERRHNETQDSFKGLSDKFDDMDDKVTDLRIAMPQMQSKDACAKAQTAIYDKLDAAKNGSSNGISYKALLVLTPVIGGLITVIILLVKYVIGE